MIDNSVFTDKKVAFLTLGCKLNFTETSYIGRNLIENGFRKVKTGEKADVCIINTCSVTEIADKKSRQAINKLAKTHPDSFVVVTGCYAQLKPEEVAKLENVDLVLGANEKFSIIEHLENLEKKETNIFHTDTKEIKQFFPSVSQDDRTRYFLKVQDGCDYFCTYCTIPFARGRNRNASIADTVALARKVAAEGAKEIVIAGINTGEFGKSTGETFFELIQALEKVQGIERFRISSIEPNLLTDEILNFVAKSEKFAPHFHIPLQAGSNDVLKLMKRRYNRELFAEKTAKIKQLMPDAFIGVDVIVGTRGETEEFFEDARQFIEGLDISQLHVFTYSERAGTQALKIEHKVSPQEKKRRSDILHAISEEKTRKFYKSQIGKQAKVLWESKKDGTKMSGFTENYVRVTADYEKSLINEVQEVVLGGFEDNKDIVSLRVKE
jgi:threonylcarbamoyladenosine tRNA methylthiotransferase MtaB